MYSTNTQEGEEGIDGVSFKFCTAKGGPVEVCLFPFKDTAFLQLWGVE